MSKISVVMPVYNAEKYLSMAIKSVLKQSYEDFELLIIDDGSNDNSVAVVRSFDDKRIQFIQNTHHFIDSLNIGLKEATGKYIARMDADDVMHLDRLKIQHAIMEEEPAITVCGTWMQHFGENIKEGTVGKSHNGLIEFPLCELLRGNFMAHPTVMIRRDFLKAHDIQYRNYPYAEDYHLWTEIAKRQGVFYIESQPLLYYRISADQVSHHKQKEQMNSSETIKKEIVEYLIRQYPSASAELTMLYDQFIALNNKELIDLTPVFSFFYYFFAKNKNTCLKY